MLSSLPSGAAGQGKFVSQKSGVVKQPCFLLLALVLLASGFSGCASMSRNAHYSKMAGEHDFDYFFPSSDFTRAFSTIDEAYDYVNAASIKFGRASSKSSAKGLAAKLTGSAPEADTPVSLVCYLRASDGSGAVDLSGRDNPMENALRRAVSATLVFLVFHNGKAVSISDFRLAQGWVYSSGNAQIEQFTVNETTYTAEYPVGWGIEKAFGYLKDGIN
jgi:hypothetical protein